MRGLLFYKAYRKFYETGVLLLSGVNLMPAANVRIKKTNSIA